MMEMLRFVRQYERDLATAEQVAPLIIEVTVEQPTAEILARLPEAVLSEIRTIAINPESWDHLKGVLGPIDDAYKRSYSARWRASLTRWKEVFGIDDAR